MTPMQDTMQDTAYAGQAVDDDLWGETALRRARWLRRTVVWASRLALFIAILAAWQYSSGRVFDSVFVSSPVAVAERTREWLQDGTIAANMWTTVVATLLGFAYGALAGVAVGFLLGRVRFLSDLFDPFMMALYALPRIALAPLFILWFGIGLTSRVVLSASIVFFLVFYNTLRGAREVDSDLVDVVRIMGAKRLTLFWHVIVPSSATWVFTGIQMSIPYALTGAIVGEIIASSDGLGHQLQLSANTFDTAGVFVMLVAITVIASVLNLVAQLAERASARWNVTPQ